MKTNEMTSKEIEELITQETEKSKIDIATLKSEQREKIRELRAALNKKKKQEHDKMVKEVGEYAMSLTDKLFSHDPDMTTEKYKERLQKVFNFVKPNM